jgi:hypothetical protein
LVKRVDAGLRLDATIEAFRMIDPPTGIRGERQEMRNLITTLHERSLGLDREPTAGDRSGFGQTLLALARTLDSHVERYDSGVVPLILRALFLK